MKMTNAKMWEAIQTLSSVDETGKLGYACARNLRKQYGTDEGNGKYTFDQEKAKEFTDAIREYAIIEHDVDIFQVSEDVFCSGSLTTKEMYALDWMVKEEAE